MFWLVCMHVGWMVFINISLFLIPFLCVTYKHLLFHYISYQLVKWLLFFSIKRGENCMYSIFAMSIVCSSYVRECFNAKSFESEIFIFSSMETVCVCCFLSYVFHCHFNFVGVFVENMLTFNMRLLMLFYSVYLINWLNYALIAKSFQKQARHFQSTLLLFIRMLPICTETVFLQIHTKAH